MIALENAVSWSYTTNTWRQVNNNAANQVDFVIGVSEDFVTVFGTIVAGYTSTNNGDYLYMAVGIGCNNTNMSATPGGAMLGIINTGAQGYAVPIPPIKVQAQARVEELPATGRNFFALCETVMGSQGTIAILGANSVPSQTGITATCMF